MKDRVEYHRKSWTELESVYTQLLTQGAGEAITDPIYFGKKFYDKPLFTYATEPTFQEVDDVTADVRDYMYRRSWYHMPVMKNTDPTNYMFGSYPYGTHWGRVVMGTSNNAVHWWPGESSYSYNFATRGWVVEETDYSNWTGWHEEDMTFTLPGANGSKLWSRAVNADFSDLATPGVNNSIPIHGSTGAGTTVQFETSTHAPDISGSPYIQIGFDFRTLEGGLISTSTSSARYLTTSPVVQSHSAVAPTGTVYVGVFVAMYGTSGIVHMNHFDWSGMTMAHDLAPTAQANFGNWGIRDGGFEHQPHLGYIPRWDESQVYVHTWDFMQCWMQSPPLTDPYARQRFFFGRGDISTLSTSFTSYVTAPPGEVWGDLYKPWLEAEWERVIPYWNLGGADGVLRKAGGDAVYKGTPEMYQVAVAQSHGGIDIELYEDDDYWSSRDALRTSFTPSTSGTPTLPNSLRFFTYDTQVGSEPWRYSQVNPGDYFTIDIQFKVFPVIQDQFTVDVYLELYDEDHNYLGVSSKKTIDTFELETTVRTGYPYTVGDEFLNVTDETADRGSGHPVIIENDQMMASWNYRATSTKWRWSPSHGYNGTTAANHAAGTPIYLPYRHVERIAIVPETVGGGTPAHAMVRMDFNDTSTGDHPELEIVFWPWSITLFPGVFNQPHTPSATSEWLLRRDGSPNFNSRFCATYVFGSETNSRWLCPVDLYGWNLWHVWAGEATQPPDSYGDMDPYMEATGGWWFESAGGVIQVYETAEDALRDNYRWIPALNPQMKGCYYRFEVWADQPISFEAYHIAWYEAWAQQLDSNGQVFWPTWDAAQSDNPEAGPFAPPVRVSEVVAHSGSGWETFEVWFPLPYGEGLWDNWPTQTVAFRALNGTAGQVVKLDNVEMSYDYVNNSDFLDTTVGVAEWIKDEHDLYIGARLWVKVGAG